MQPQQSWGRGVGVSPRRASPRLLPPVAGSLFLLLSPSLLRPPPLAVQEEHDCCQVKGEKETRRTEKGRKEKRTKEAEKKTRTKKRTVTMRKKKKTARRREVR